MYRNGKKLKVFNTTQGVLQVISGSFADNPSVAGMHGGDGKLMCDPDEPKLFTLHRGSFKTLVDRQRHLHSNNYLKAEPFINPLVKPDPTD